MAIIDRLSKSRQRAGDDQVLDQLASMIPRAESHRGEKAKGGKLGRREESSTIIVNGHLLVSIIESTYSSCRPLNCSRSLIHAASLSWIIVQSTMTKTYGT